MKNPAWALLCALLIPWGASPKASGCGTARLFGGTGLPGAKSGAYGMLLAGSGTPRARTLVSSHFLLHYTLRGEHRIKTLPEDNALVRMADSIYAGLSGLSGARRDSALYARLDAADAAHPAFASRYLAHFERAWTHYVEDLGMRAPQARIRSRQYTVRSGLPARFPIDMVDVGTAEADFAGETYGITFPPPGLSITVENDFLWNSQLGPDGIPTGTPIMSRMEGKVIRDYSKDWELGIQVTVYHEFYHAVQFTYVPSPRSYHMWYEISAVGMEERMAPEVDDYLQYLPYALKNTASVSLDADGSALYGQGIFHVYLSESLDSAFDVAVWTELARNGDRIQGALETAFAGYGESMSRLFPDFASQLAFSGPGTAKPPGLFSPDMAKWPALAADTLDMENPAPYRQIDVRGLAFAAIRVKWGPRAQLRLVETGRIEGVTRAHSDPGIAGAGSESIAGDVFALPPPRAGFTGYTLILPNPDFQSGAVVRVRDPDPGFYVFPNPSLPGRKKPVRFTQAKGMAYPARIEVFGEDGIKVRELSFPDGSAVPEWDLKDADAKPVPSGIYYYRLESGPMQTLLVAP